MMMATSMQKKGLRVSSSVALPMPGVKHNPKPGAALVGDTEQGKATSPSAGLDNQTAIDPARDPPQSEKGGHKSSSGSTEGGGDDVWSDAAPEALGADWTPPPRLQVAVSALDATRVSATVGLL